MFVQNIVLHEKNVMHMKSFLLGLFEISLHHY